MSVLEKFGEMSAEYSHCADFATIYIEEAHPSEKANFSGKLGNYQKDPKSELLSFCVCVSVIPQK